MYGDSGIFLEGIRDTAEKLRHTAFASFSYGLEIQLRMYYVRRVPGMEFL